MIIAARIIGGILILAWIFYIFIARIAIRAQGRVMYATIFQFNILPFIVGVSLIIYGRLSVLIVLPVAWILSRFYPLFFFLSFPLIVGWCLGSHVFESIFPNSSGWYWGGGIIGVAAMSIFCTIVTAIVLVPPRDTYTFEDRMNQFELNHGEILQEGFKKNILIADCDIVFADLLEKIIHKAADNIIDVNVHASWRDQEIRQLMEEQSWNLLILSLTNICFGDGKVDIKKAMELAVNLKSIYNIPVILLSVEPNMSLNNEVLSKVDYCFPKPCNVQSLRQAVCECLGINPQSNCIRKELLETQS